MAPVRLLVCAMLALGTLVACASARPIDHLARPPSVLDSIEDPEFFKVRFQAPVTQTAPAPAPSNGTSTNSSSSSTSNSTAPAASNTTQGASQPSANATQTATNATQTAASNTTKTPTNATQTAVNATQTSANGTASNQTQSAASAIAAAAANLTSQLQSSIQQAQQLLSQLPPVDQGIASKVASAPRRRLVFDPNGRLGFLPLNNNPVFVPVTRHGFVAPERDNDGKLVVRRPDNFKRERVPLNADGTAAVYARDAAGNGLFNTSDGVTVSVPLNQRGFVIAPRAPNGFPVVFDYDNRPFTIVVSRSGYPRVERDGKNLPVVTTKRVRVTYGTPHRVQTTASGDVQVFTDPKGRKFVRDLQGHRLTPELTSNGTVKSSTDSAGKPIVRPVIEFDILGRKLWRDSDGHAFVHTDAGRKISAPKFPLTIPSARNVMPGVYIDGDRITAESNLTALVRVEGIPRQVLAIPGERGRRGPRGKPGPRGPHGRSYRNVTNSLQRAVRKLKREVTHLKGKQLAIKSLNGAVFPKWAEGPTACPDGWKRLRYVKSEGKVYCAPPRNAATPENAACKKVAKFPKRYDRCGWSILCKAPWQKKGCYEPPSSVAEAPVADPYAYRPRNRRHQASVANAVADSVPSLLKLLRRSIAHARPQSAGGWDIQRDASSHAGEVAYGTAAEYDSAKALVSSILSRRRSLLEENAAVHEDVSQLLYTDSDPFVL